MNLVDSLIIILILIIFSAICSGLNISLMALDIGDLRRKAKLGNISAQRVLPLRQKTHLSLASILLTNVAAVSATSLVLEQHLNGFIAIGLSTLLIVIFGEVLPQAFFAKNALGWTSRLSLVLKLMVFVTYPISKPLELLLNKIVGQTKRKLQTRHELGMLITEHLGSSASELDEDEVEIIRGALQLSEKRIDAIMTPIEKVYWLTTDTVLADKKIDEIKYRSFSRIPIFDHQLTRCYGLVLMKELVDINFDDNHYKVSDMALHPVEPVGSRTALDTMFRIFITAGTHLIPVEKSGHIIGVIAIEDLLEEILGHEIEDETDRRKNR